MAARKRTQYKLRKSKATAIILAVLFGPLVWAYTYKFDAWKLWVNLFLILISLGLWGIVAWLWAVIDTAIRDDLFYEEYYKLVR